MGGLIAPKPKKPGKSAEVIAAEQRAAEAEAKAALEAKQLKEDEEYRRTRQRGKASTVLTVQPQATNTHSLLGG